MAMKRIVRDALESLYVGKCTITGMTEVTDPETFITTFSEQTICENEPCRVSFSGLTAAVKSDTVSSVEQVIKLFIRPELVIPAGSKVTVTQNGKTAVYVSSGEPAVYTNHQEIILNIGDDKA